MEIIGGRANPEFRLGTRGYSRFDRRRPLVVEHLFECFWKTVRAPKILFVRLLDKPLPLGR
jgi:hypothetical protein